MITLSKESNKDFIVLNLTDTQLGTTEWEEEHKNREILIDTHDEMPYSCIICKGLSGYGNDHAYSDLCVPSGL